MVNYMIGVYRSSHSPVLMLEKSLNGCGVEERLQMTIDPCLHGTHLNETRLVHVAKDL